MSTLPPDNAGWVGSDGVPRRGTPPPGWWQASDLRWYPPQAPSGPPPAPAAPSAPSPPPPAPSALSPPPPAPSAPAPAVPAAPPAPAPAAPVPGPGAFPVGGQAGGVVEAQLTGAVAPARKSRSGCIVGLLAAILVVLLGGCGALVLLGAGGLSLFATSGAGGSSSAADPIGAPDLLPPANPAVEVQSCTLVGDQTYQLDLVNQSIRTADYVLNVDFVNDAGTTVGSQPVTVHGLSSGQRAIETGIAFNGSWSTCTARVDKRTEVTAAPDRSGVSCQISGPDTQRRVQATTTVTNSSAKALRFNVEVAWVDNAGIRRGTGLARLAPVPAGQTGSDRLVTLTPYRADLKCAVVDVQRVG